MRKLAIAWACLACECQGWRLQASSSPAQRTQRLATQRHSRSRDRGWVAPAMGATSTPALEFGPDDETVASALQSFGWLRTKFRKEGQHDESIICALIMGLRLLKDSLNRTYLGPSDIHGDGVFASRDIGKGELITFFPGDALIIDNWEGQDSPPIISFGPHIPDAERNRFKFQTVYAKNYSLHVHERITAVGDPTRRDCPAYLGHFVNDASTCPSPDHRERYMNESVAGANAEAVFLDDAHFALVATRPILKDAEVLFTYGAGYWLEYNGHPNATKTDLRCEGDSHLIADAKQVAKELKKERMKKPKNNTKTGKKVKFLKKANTTKAEVKGFGVRQDEATKGTKKIKDKFEPESKAYGD